MKSRALVKCSAALLACTGLGLAQKTGGQVAGNPASGPSAGRTILLWPDGAPGAKGAGPLDRPTLTIYLPAQNPTHTGIVICPGGGYEELAVDWEGTQVAQWLNARGVAAFVLTYRYGPRYHHPIPLLDAQRAIRMVRANAIEENIDPTRVGIWGFSAGGHLASTAGTHFDSGNAKAQDPIERAGSRPDFMVLAYPVITMQTADTHGGSLHNLLGEHPDPMLQMELSNELHVTPQTPPTFLFSTTNDAVVPVINSVLFYQALLRSGVPAELHIFEQGNHGSSLGQGNAQLELWPVLLQNWLHLHGWMAQGAR